MNSSVDAALGRVALVLRLIGALWMVMLASVYGVTGELDDPPVATGVTVLGVAWALVAWGSGRMRRIRTPDWPLLAADLVVTAVVILVPAVAQESAGFIGGYPFAALVVGLAAAGRRGVVVATGVLCTCTVAALVLVGSRLGAFAAGQLLLYVLGAVALWIGLDVIRRNEHRVRSAEAALTAAEERAALAAHLHDSVLQTLALVQRRADDAGAVRSLAKRQERELREWLFPSGSPAAPRDPAPEAVPRTVGAALQHHAEEVEERYGIAVRVVTAGGAAGLAVGDDERAGAAAVVLAAREAMANAAVHAGVDAVDVFVEADGDALAVYVRDRGTGFDPDGVPGDRQGIRGSIVGRVERAGGTAEVDSRPGAGTEVRLRVAVGSEAWRSA